MSETRYGKNKVLYGVTETSDKRIQLHVYHSNSEMRRVLSKAVDNPRQLLTHYKFYLGSSIRAKHWLSQVITDYRIYFEDNRVDIVLS